ncbi:MAG: radical SAM protein [Bacteroidales bacterium]|nr:radical SAM protein [Bacteroidales bacterium]
MQREEALNLLKTDTTSDDFYKLISRSNQQSRKQFGSKGFVFAQIGMNAEPCSKNCGFCSLGSSHYSVEGKWQIGADEIITGVQSLLKEGMNDFFLMTTADYPIKKFIEISAKVRKHLPDSVRFVANIGDFDLETAKEFKAIGITGAYHIKRFREGIDTLIKPEIREKTIENILNAGLELYYCIEPVGPEHSYDEILDLIYFSKQFPIDAMAVMRRIPVPGTPLFSNGQINAMELTKIVAVTNLVIKPSRSMNVHEPTQMSLLAGVNQLYAEVGANPRDTHSDTKEGRGFSPTMAWQMLAEAGYYPEN